jgi:hypothetical protein
MDNLLGNDSMIIGKELPGTLCSAALCIRKITSVMIGSVTVEILLPNPIIDTTLAA